MEEDFLRICSSSDPRMGVGFVGVVGARAKANKPISTPLLLLSSSLLLTSMNFESGPSTITTRPITTSRGVSIVNLMEVIDGVMDLEFSSIR